MTEQEESDFKEIFDKYRSLTDDRNLFQKNLDIYSEFMTIIDSDFCYNQTFLREYLDDLYSFREKLLLKEVIYEQVFDLCDRLNFDYKIELDGTFSKKVRWIMMEE